MKRWEHKDVVFQFSEKAFTLIRKQVPQGLDEATKGVVYDLGREGWELVSVIPYPRADGKFTATAVAFFKRELG